MTSLHERISERFYNWEHRGRGWQVFEYPVPPEPPFVPFPGHHLPETEAVDDGIRPTILSSLVQKLSRRLATRDKPPTDSDEPDEESAPKLLVRDSLIE